MSRQILVEVDEALAEAAEKRAAELRCDMSGLFTAFLIGLTTKRRRRSSQKAMAPSVATDVNRPSVAKALEALASEANMGRLRFYVPTGAEFDKRWIRPLQALVADFSDIEQWRTHGRWLSAGHQDWRMRDGKPLSVSYVVGPDFRANMGIAMKWAQNGGCTASICNPSGLASDPEEWL